MAPGFGSDWEIVFVLKRIKLEVCSVGGWYFAVMFSSVHNYITRQSASEIMSSRQVHGNEFKLRKLKIRSGMLHTRHKLTKA